MASSCHGTQPVNSPKGVNVLCHNSHSKVYNNNNNILCHLVGEKNDIVIGLELFVYF